MAGSGMEGREIQVGVLVKEITQNYMGGPQEGRQGFGTWGGVMQQPCLQGTFHWLWRCGGKRPWHQPVT